MYLSVVEVIQLNTEKLLQLANSAYQNGDSDKALGYCKELLVQAPTDAKGLRLKAIILGTEGRLAEAIEIISQVLLASSMQEEPCDYFYRGRWLIRNGQSDQAIVDFAALIAIEKAHDRIYYTDVALLYRAYALKQLGREREAIADLKAIEDEDCSSWIGDGMVSKRSLLASLGA